VVGLLGVAPFLLPWPQHVRWVALAASTPMDPWGMGGTEWQRHRSGWSPEEFPEGDGWTVIACRDFHKVDGYGRPLAQPFGVVQAISNNAPPGERT